MEEIIWKISDVNSTVRQIIEGGLAPFWLEGEIGTLTIHRSGHVYFILKDKKSQIRAVFWRGADFVRRMCLVTGSKIEAFGQLTVYETRGEYQFSITNIRPIGLGDLQRKFEELKTKLSSEGLFDENKKKPIPVLPRSIGIVTSSSGAAIRDFLNIINRRFPNIHIRIYPAPVQGKGAELKVAKGVRFFNQHSPVDVIVITRGGGSMEDLWPFNSETLARTISESNIPVISAVGHEIDFTICDFVSDMRVPTPSSAAELVIGRQQELQQNIKDLKRRLRSTLELYKERLKRRYEKAANSYVFKDPTRIINERQQYVDELYTKIYHSLELKFEREKSRFTSLLGKLKTMSPDSVLKRGYSIITLKDTKKVITNANILPGTEVNAILKEGTLDLVVIKTKN
jgi:exodeoxyribonuclease VII large subunit